MAVVGFEADQVRRTPQGDVSVPITVAYNHHYGARLIGKGSRMEKVRRSETADHRAMHPGPDPGRSEVPVEHTPSLSGQPTSMVFGYSNGSTYSGYHRLVITWRMPVATKTTQTTILFDQVASFERRTMDWCRHLRNWSTRLFKCTAPPCKSTRLVQPRITLSRRTAP